MSLWNQFFVYEMLERTDNWASSVMLQITEFYVVLALLTQPLSFSVLLLSVFDAGQMSHEKGMRCLPYSKHDF